MRTNLTILHKGLLIVAAPFLFQLLLIAFLFSILRDSDEAQRWSLHTKEVIAQADAVLLQAAEMYGRARDLVLTGDERVRSRLVKAYRETAAALPDRVAQLRAQVHDSGAQQARLDRFDDRAGKLRARLDVVENMAASGRRDEATAALQQLADEHPMEGLRELIDGFLRVERNLEEQRRAALEATREKEHWTLGVAFALSFVLAGGVLFAFNAGIRRRFAVVMGNAQRLAAGKELSDPLRGEDEIAAVDRAFHEMARTLRERERENELFIYSVSHDLRSPLVNLEGFSKELSLSCRELRTLCAAVLPPEPKVRVLELLDRDMPESVQYIQSAVARLSAIIDALLRLSRSGRVEYRWQEVDVAAVVARVIQAVRSTIEQRKAVVRAGPLPPAWGDATAIEQVFANLIINALNYLDPARPGVVEIGADDSRCGPGMRAYYVKDNGLGVPAAYLGKLFVAFQRLHGDAAAGEGIGLALVRRMVERHGGSVWAESENGAGSTFWLTLPTEPPPAGAVVPPPRPAAIQRQESAHVR
jgi:signal transduction histidine kinase